MACQRSHSKYGRELGFEPRSLRARYPLEMMLGRRAGGETISGLLNFAIMANSESDHPLWGCPGHCGMFSSIPDTHPLDARSMLSQKS